MLFEAILTLKGQKPLGTRLMYSPPTSVSTAIFSDYRRSNKTSQYIFIQLKRIKGKTLRQKLPEFQKLIRQGYILNIPFCQNLFLVLLEVYEKTLNQFRIRIISNAFIPWLFFKINWHKNIFVNLTILTSFTYFTHMPHLCY